MTGSPASETARTDARAAAARLLAAWADPACRLDALPEGLRPRDLAEAYAIQEAVAEGLGPIGGWKVGAAGPEAPCTCAPMPLAGLHESPAQLPSLRFTDRMVEAEICVRLAHDLPRYDAPFTRDQILDAIDTVHPGLEVLQSRFRDPDALDPMALLADSLSHGAYVIGPPVHGWRALDLAAERVRLLVGGREAVARTGNPAGDMIRLLLWLANEGAHWAGGLKAGQIVTTGSWTGKTAVPAATPVRAVFARAGTAELEFR